MYELVIKHMKYQSKSLQKVHTISSFIDGLVQEYSVSIVSTLDILQSCT